MTKEIIIITVIINLFSALIFHLAVKYNDKYDPIKKLLKTKIIKIIGFILLYLLPIGSIIFMLLDKTIEPTFKNIGLFIIICVTFVYNILMSHIISIYKMIVQLTNISSDKLTKIDATFEKVYNHIEKTKRDNNLK
jgi:hypothetical protein